MSKFSQIWSKSGVMRTKRSRALTIGAVIALLGAIYVVMLFLNNKDILMINDDIQISIIGSTDEFTGKSRLEYRDGEMLFENGNINLTLDGMPVYYKNEEKLLLTTSMIYTNYDAGMMNRVSYLSSIEQVDNIFQITIDKNKERSVNGGYLFDGKNMYLFLEPVTITWEDTTMELAPLSYICVLNKQCYYYYSSEDNKAEYVKAETGTVWASEKDGKYQLNLSQDIVDFPDGKSLLLMPSPESFELIK